MTDQVLGRVSLFHQPSRPPDVQGRDSPWPEDSVTRPERSSVSIPDEAKGHPNLARNVLLFRTDMELTQQALADMIGKTKGFISGIENEKWGASQDTLRELTVVFNCSLDDLFADPPTGGARVGKSLANKGVKRQAGLDPERYVFVRRYEAIGGLGAGRFNEQHVEVSGTHAYRLDMIRARGWRPEALAVIEAEGPSMEPTINDGDVVLVNMDESQIVSGKVYAIEDPGHGTRIKRLFKQIDGRVRVVSDNGDKRLYPDDYLTPDSGARIIGRAVDRSGSL